MRVLENRQIRRVGSSRTTKIDVRVIAATHQPLEALVGSKRFREDLLHRLNVLRIRLPPLRERRADIPLLAQHFFAAAAAQLQTQAKSADKALLDAMQTHAWPGNVRELENACWRMASGTSHERLGVSDWQGDALPMASTGSAAGWETKLAQETRTLLQQGHPSVHAELKARFEQSLLDAALQHTHGHRQQAAHLLGLGRNTLTRKLGVKHVRKDEA